MWFVVAFDACSDVELLLGNLFREGDKAQLRLRSEMGHFFMRVTATAESKVVGAGGSGTSRTPVHGWGRSLLMPAMLFSFLSKEVATEHRLRVAPPALLLVVGFFDLLSNNDLQLSIG